MRMKQFIYWFFGVTAGRALLSYWRWLWDKPLVAGGTVTLEAAKDSLAHMQESVQSLVQSVSSVVAVDQQAQTQLQAKEKEREDAETQANLAMVQGNEATARYVITQVIALEQLIPQLQQRVDQAEEMKQKSQAKLQSEHEKLMARQLEMGNLKAISEMNAALSQVIDLAGHVGVDAAHSHFQDSEQAIKKRHLQVQVNLSYPEIRMSRLSSS